MWGDRLIRDRVVVVRLCHSDDCVKVFRSVKIGNVRAGLPGLIDSGVNAGFEIHRGGSDFSGSIAPRETVMRENTIAPISKRLIRQSMSVAICDIAEMATCQFIIA